MKTNDVFQKPERERFTFCGAEAEQRCLLATVGWKDIANILTITCFPGCFFVFFAGGCFVLLYIKLSAD